MREPTLTPRLSSIVSIYWGMLSQVTSTVRSTSIGIASTYDRNSAARSKPRPPGFTGARATEQFPITTVVDP